MAKSKPTNPKKVYWDACVFLSIIEDNKDRMPAILYLIDECKKGNIEIWTSTLSIAEVAFAKSEKDQRSLDADVLRRINKLWLPSSPFKMVEVYRQIVNDAQTYVRESLLFGSIKPPDAIHLASAKRIKASEFHTYDDFDNKSKQVSELVGITIKQPQLDGLPFTS